MRLVALRYTNEFTLPQTSFTFSRAFSSLGLPSTEPPASMMGLVRRLASSFHRLSPAATARG